MGHCFSHLSRTDRYKIEALLNKGISKKEIASELHVHISTIYREIKRARMVQLTTDYVTVNRYNPDLAEKRYRDNLSAKGPPLKIGGNYSFADFIESKILKEHCSPAVALHLAKLENFDISVSVSTLYSYISKGVFLTLSDKNLLEKPKRKRSYHKTKSVKRAPRGESIENRPQEVKSRASFGHWEMDTVYSRKDLRENNICITTVQSERAMV